MKRLLGLPVRAAVVMLAMASFSLTSCSADEDLVFFSERVFHTPMSEFLVWWKAGHGGATGQPQLVDFCWTYACLDSAEAKAGYWDFSTDFCSNPAPDTGLYFDFKAPCMRHDVSWRNLKKMQARWGSGFDTHTKRVATSEQFKVDMYDHCATRAGVAGSLCRQTANLYYDTVLQFA